MLRDTGSGASGRGPVHRTTYAPAVRPDQLPATAAEWRRRTGLTDPSVLAAVTRLRATGFRNDPSYADFFAGA